MTAAVWTNNGVVTFAVEEGEIVGRVDREIQLKDSGNPKGIGGATVNKQLGVFVVRQV